MKTRYSYQHPRTATTVRITVRDTVRAGLMAALGCAIPFLTSCGRNTSLLDGLLNAGMVQVSPQNPYVGANLFLAQEMEKSGQLHNFIRMKGPPQGLELAGSRADVLEMRMFYPRKMEMYVAVPYFSGDPVMKEWIIRGPYTVNKSYYRQVTLLPRDESATFEMWGAKQVLGTGSVSAAESRVIYPAFVPTATPTPRPIKKKRPAASQQAPTGTPAPTSQQTDQPMNFDQRALIESKELAERSPNGDLVHTVQNPQETVTSIANWYAGSSEHAAAIAEKNNVPLDAKMHAGARIFVPAELVKNPKVMK
jgi:hypothetical protein